MKNKDLGFFRVAIGIPTVYLAQPMENAMEILSFINAAHRSSAQLLALPELSLTGYTCKDLFLDETLLEEAKKGLQTIIDAMPRGIIAIVGMPLRIDDALFNVAVVLLEGKIIAVVPKEHIPNYKEFEERRWFTPASHLTRDTITLCGQEVRIGTDQIISIPNLNVRIGVEICEDVWLPIQPSGYMALAGANVIVNLSASNAVVGKRDYRHRMIAQRSADQICAYIYVSCGYGESTTDVVFDGDALIAENGAVLLESARFSRESQLMVAEVNIGALIHDRTCQGTFNDNLSTHHVQFREMRVEIDGLNFEKDHRLVRYIDPHPFVPSNRETLAERCKEIFDIQSVGLASRLESLDKKTSAIGISGGLDSTLALLVAIRAFEMLKLPRSGIDALTMPGFGTTDRTRNNAIELCKLLGTAIDERPIVKTAEEILRAAGHEPCHNCLKCENAQARARTVVLMTRDFTIGTGDMSEAALGWSTYGGDQLSMYNPNAGVPKTLVKFVVRWVAEQNMFGDDVSKILFDILDTPISPELLPATSDGKISQKTEEKIGPYELVDFFLYWLIRYGTPPSKIYFLACLTFNGKYTPEEIKKWLGLFIRRFFNNQFKRDANPGGPKVGTVALGQRGDWRTPTNASAKVWLADLNAAFTPKLT